MAVMIGTSRRVALAGCSEPTASISASTIATTSAIVGGTNHRSAPPGPLARNVPARLRSKPKPSAAPAIVNTRANRTLPVGSDDPSGSRLSSAEARLSDAGGAGSGAGLSPAPGHPALGELVPATARSDCRGWLIAAAHGERA